MGPHPLWQLEDLLPDLRLQPGDRVLDLGFAPDEVGFAWVSTVRG